MLDWLWKQATKIFTRAQDQQAARTVDQCLLELAQIRQELNEKLTEKCWSVDKIVIERLQADKVELNLGSIDVRELSGMLSIGFNYGGKLIKADSKGGGKITEQPLARKTHEEQTAKQSMNIGIARQAVKTPPGGASSAQKAPPGKGPRLNILFKN